MAAYNDPPEWPLWVRGTHKGHLLVKIALLQDLPDTVKDARLGANSSILRKVDNLLLQQLVHYKCKTDWNHEFIMAKLFDQETKSHLMMVWERDLPLLSGKPEAKRTFQIKSGMDCDAVDRVAYLSGADFNDFCKKKQAVPLRYASVIP